jgi:(R,R)-butanediol dehydrogenase / meso-butanediol dehydrogenase / diacetyl reductase
VEEFIMAHAASRYEGNKTFGVADVEATAAGPGQVQVAVSHCGICGTDLHIFLGHMDQRVTMPAVIGHEMSGVITEVGADVTDWQTGDRVVVRPLDHCGDCPACKAGHSHICQNLKFIGIDSPGAFQQRWTVPAHTLHRLPDDVSLEHGAMIEPLAVACHDVRLGKVTADDYVVVIGGGPIGILVALVAQKTGARVLISEVNEFRIELAKELGVEAVNPTKVDLVELVNEQTGTAGADVVFEVSGAAAGAEIMTQLPRTRGRIVIVGIHAQPPKVDLFKFFWRELQLCGARVYESEDFEQAIQLAADGSIPLDRLITGRHPLAGLQSALEKIEAGSNDMKVLIEVGGV